MSTTVGISTILGVAIATPLFTADRALALTEGELRSNAQAMTVRIDAIAEDGAQGSGVIVGKDGDTYTLLTNWHVVEDPGDYILQTSNGDTYSFSADDINRLPGIDLAEVQFTSTQFYERSRFGSFSEILEGDTVYVAGWMNPGPVIRERAFDMARGRLVTGRMPEIINGYSFAYTLDNIQQGTSGGPILNGDGDLIGISGLGIADLKTRSVELVAGIPVETYVDVAGIVVPPVLPRPSIRRPTIASDIPDLPPHQRLQIYLQDISAEITRLRTKIRAFQELERASSYERQNPAKISENLPEVYIDLTALDEQIEEFRLLTYRSEQNVTEESFLNLLKDIRLFKSDAAVFRSQLDELYIQVTPPESY